MHYQNKLTGKIGEEFAVEYLKSEDYSILQTNYNCRWGELDIITKKEDKIIFVEVKTRIGQYLGKPHESIHVRKLKHLTRTIQYYLLQHKLYKEKLQLDVISIVLTKDKTVEDFQHFENVPFG